MYKIWEENIKTCITIFQYIPPPPSDSIQYKPNMRFFGGPSMDEMRNNEKHKF